MINTIKKLNKIENHKNKLHAIIADSKNRLRSIL